MRPAICIAVLLLSMLITGCDNAPSLTIENKSPIPIIVTVEEVEEGGLNLHSLPPGEKIGLLPTSKNYRVAAAPSDEWRKEAIAARSYLSEKLSKASILTGVEIRDLESRLKSIDNKIDALARQSSAHCTVQIQSSGCNTSSEESKRKTISGLVYIWQEDNGALDVECSTVEK